VRRQTLLTAVAVLALAAPPASAHPGALDASFSHDGIQTAFPNGAVGYAVAIDHHDRIVVAGSTLAAHPDIALARFTPNGRLDTTFGQAGKVVTDLGANDYAFDLAIQDNGGIVVVGLLGRDGGPLSCDRPEDLAGEAVGHLLDARVADSLGASVAWPEGRAEQIVPETQDDPKVLRHAALARLVVMPEVHARVVEHVAHRSEPYVQVGVIEVAPYRRDDGDREDRFGRSVEPGQRQPLEALVDQDLRPVEAPVADPVHGRDRVMDLVEGPEPRRTVQQVVDAPLKEVGEDQEQQELPEEGPSGHGRAFELEAQEVERPRGGECDGTGQASGQDGEEMAVQRDEPRIAKPARAQQVLLFSPREQGLDQDERGGGPEEPLKVRHAKGPSGLACSRPAPDCHWQAAGAPLAHAVTQSTGAIAARP